MRKVPRHYHGDEITKEVISEIKEIAKKGMIPIYINDVMRMLIVCKI